MNHRRVASALVIAAFVAACGGTSPAPQTPPPSPPPSPGPSADPAWTFAAALPASADYVPPSEDGPWIREVEKIGPDGIPDRETALRLFALAFGAVPGVDVQPEGRVIRSATLAIRAVRAHWDDLTVEQRTAIDEALELPYAVVSLEIPASGEASSDGRVLTAGPLPPGRSRGTQLTAAEQNAPYTDEVLKSLREAGASVRSTIAGKMGGDDISGPIHIDLAPCQGNKSDPDAPSETPLGCAEGLFGTQAPGTPSGPGAYQGCRVRLTSVALAGGASVVVNTLAHEIFHCFQFHGYETVGRFATAPSWVIEGGAEWVGNEVTGDLAETDYLYNPWFIEPGKTLFGRSYSAVGFWSHLDESGTDPYRVFQFVWATGDSPAAFRGSGAADNAAFLESWASSLTRKDAFGRDWDAEGDGIPGRDVQAKADPWPVTNGSTVEVHAEPYTARVFQLDVSADILRISGSGHGRISDGSVDTVGFPAAFCTRAGGCDPCPGSDQVPPAPLGSDPYFVLTGGVAGSTFTIAGEAMDATCPTPSPSQPSPSPSDDDEFCRRYRALVAWSQNPTEEELTRPWARYIHEAAVDLRAVAPPGMVEWVEVLVEVYRTYANTREPFNVPRTGPLAARLGEAIPALHAYCGIPG